MQLKDFRLRKLKVNGNVVDIEYQKSGSDDNMSVTKKNAPHPDMRMKMNKYCEYIKEVFDMNPDNEGITVNGITISERKQEKIICVQATLTTMTGHKTAINTPVIGFDDQTYKESPKLFEYTNAIAEETFMYLFGTKQAQQVMFSEEEPPPAPELELETKEEKTTEKTSTKKGKSDKPKRTRSKK